MPSFQVLRTATENNRMVHASLRGLIAQRKWVFGAMALALVISTLFFSLYPPLYTSSVSFYVTGSPVSEQRQPIYLSLHTDASTLEHIGTSTAMLDHLIDKFGLIGHYDIVGDERQARERAHWLLDRRLAVELREDDLVMVMVKDNDRAMAAALANELFVASDSMLRAEQRAQLSAQLHVYEQVVDSTERVARTRTAELQDMVHTLGELRAGGSDGAWEQRVEVVERALLDAAKEIAFVNNALVAQYRDHANLLAMANDPGAGAVHLRSAAAEDPGPSAFWCSVGWIILIAAGTGLATAGLILLIMESMWTVLPLRA